MKPLIEFLFPLTDGTRAHIELRPEFFECQPQALPQKPDLAPTKWHPMRDDRFSGELLQDGRPELDDVAPLGLPHGDTLEYDVIEAPDSPNLFFPASHVS